MTVRLIRALIILALANFLLYCTIEWTKASLEQKLGSQNTRTQKASLVETSSSPVEPNASTYPEQTTTPSPLLKKFDAPNMKYWRYLSEPRPILDIIMSPWKIKYNGTFHNNSDVRWSLIVMIKSQDENHVRRKGIRESWGKMKLYDGVRLEVVFIIGKSTGNDSQANLIAENEEFGDLLQIDLEETYRNVGYKTEAGMRWAGENFPPYWLYACSDDDAFPKLPMLYTVLDSIREEEVDRYEQMFGNEFRRTEAEIMSDLPIHCSYDFVRKTKPHRNTKSKYFISEKDFPAEQYPPYCQGGWFTLPVKLAKALSNISRKMNYFWLDDIWLTGFARMRHFIDRNANETLHWGEKEVGIWTKQRGGVVIHLSSKASEYEQWEEKFKSVFRHL